MRLGGAARGQFTFHRTGDFKLLQQHLGRLFAGDTQHCPAMVGQ
jgi:hypothetical protein